MERVAKSRVSNRSDSKKSDSGRNSKKSDSGTQKIGYFVSYCALFTPNFMFCFIRSGKYPTWKSQVRVSQKKSGLGR